MSKRKQHYLICYDVRDEKRWRNTYKLLKGYGRRVQYSVFHCELSDLKMSKLRWELEKCLSHEDSLLIAPIDAPDSNRLVVKGPDIGDWDDSQRFEVF
ncbi:CRISPR-associated endonuclease Cas2 [Bacillaceae bacterium]